MWGLSVALSLQQRLCVNWGSFCTFFCYLYDFCAYSVVLLFILFYTQRIADEGRACVIALNKWDAIEEKDDSTYLKGCWFNYCYQCACGIMLKQMLKTWWTIYVGHNGHIMVTFIVTKLFCPFLLHSGGECAASLVLSALGRCKWHFLYIHLYMRPLYYLTTNSPHSF